MRFLIWLAMMIVMMGMLGCSAQKTESTVETVKKEKVVEEEEKVDAPAFELVDFIQGEYQEVLNEVNEIKRKRSKELPKTRMSSKNG